MSHPSRCKPPAFFPAWTILFPSLSSIDYGIETVSVHPEREPDRNQGTGRNSRRNRKGSEAVMSDDSG
ncbi:MAG: hypothetical protein A2Z40_03755 [Deltaproteobacteria bacterium RBG_19FT_COMBO_60_16]|nr:MAG: hypothetical protein A2Z40_03755 [Deltaproteobacteria bacterium RBG_19FT_COMBO_60_16]